MASFAVRQISLARLSIRKLEKTCIRTVVSGRHNIQVINYLQNEEVERHRRAKLSQHPDVDDNEKMQEKQQVEMPRDFRYGSDILKQQVEMPRDFRYVQPEFLPTTVIQHRDRVRELLEREDMYRRRANIDIPEFYVGSLMAVTVSDKHASAKTTRFLGICIQRGGYGLRAYFILRNVIDGQGIEIMYEMYNPLVQKIEVLKLEKRLDDDLMYLRDAPLEYSTFPLNMEPVPLPKGSTVPVNTLKVKLNPRPWHERWERKDLKGVEKMEVSEKLLKRAKAVRKPWEKYDLMKHYRESINEVETDSVMKEAFIRKQAIDKEKGTKGRTGGPGLGKKR